MTLSSNILDRFDALVRTSTDGRRDAFNRRIATIRGEANRHGSVRSSMYILAVHEATVAEFQEQCELAWQELQRVLQTAGTPYDDELRTDLQRVLSATINNLSNHCQQQQHGLIGNTFAPNEMERWATRIELTAKCDHMRKKYAIEVDMYVDTLESALSKSQSQVSAPTYNFHGTVGAVQTGSSARVVQNIHITPDQKQALLRALEQVQVRIQNDPALALVADECVDELGSASPRREKLERWLGVLATSVQSIASAQPAYQALKAAALVVGIPLP